MAKNSNRDIDLQIQEAETPQTEKAKTPMPTHHSSASNTKGKGKITKAAREKWYLASGGKNTSNDSRFVSETETRGFFKRWKEHQPRPGRCGWVGPWSLPCALPRKDSRSGLRCTVESRVLSQSKCLTPAERTYFPPWFEYGLFQVIQGLWLNHWQYRFSQKAFLTS